MHRKTHRSRRIQCALPAVEKPSLALLALQSRFGEQPVKFQVVCPQNGTAVLKESERRPRGCVISRVILVHPVLLYK